MNTEGATEMTTPGSTLGELVAARRAKRAAADNAAQRQQAEREKMEERLSRETVRAWFDARPGLTAMLGLKRENNPTARVRHIRADHPEVTVTGAATLAGTTLAVSLEFDVVVFLDGTARLDSWVSIKMLWAERGLTRAEQHAINPNTSDEDALDALAGMAEKTVERAQDALQDEARAAAEKADALERGRRGAAVVKRVAQEYLDICRSHDAAVTAWAEEWAARWAPWSGWLVRYAPIGAPAGEGNIRSVLVLDELNDVIAESPGASVRAVSHDGTVRELVIGAFLDATPVEVKEYPQDRYNALYHRTLTAYTSDGRAVVVHVAPQVAESEAEPARLIWWRDYLNDRTGTDHGGYVAAREIVDTEVEVLAQRPGVQAYADAAL